MPCPCPRAVADPSGPARPARFAVAVAVAVARRGAPPHDGGGAPRRDSGVSSYGTRVCGTGWPCGSRRAVRASTCLSARRCPVAARDRGDAPSWPARRRPPRCVHPADGAGRLRIRGTLAAALLALPVVADLLVRVHERRVGDPVGPLALPVRVDGRVVGLDPGAPGVPRGVFEGRRQLLSSGHVTHLRGYGCPADRGSRDAAEVSTRHGQRGRTRLQVLEKCQESFTRCLICFTFLV